ncbi:MAG: glucosamine-6-phosphate isomerase [Acidobacteria bacterium]|nr:MAG: glucosamine-6-phosphate isomerase [Acidobacteriota bacterium]
MMTLEEILTLPVEKLADHARVGVKIYPTREALFEGFAREIAEEIKSHNARGEPTRLILPVGPTGQYPILVEICNRERISWKNVWTFNMDEWLDWQGRPLPPDHPLSFEGYMRRQVFERLDPDLRIPDDHIIFPHPFRIDELSEKIRQVGGIDTCYGGIGYHGHVAFNEPWYSQWQRPSLDEFRHSKTRVVPLHPDTIVVNSITSADGNFMAIPPMAVTMGMEDILSARRLRFYVFAGERHKTIFRIALMGEVSTEFPVTLLQEHPDCVIAADEYTAQPVRVGIR